MHLYRDAICQAGEYNGMRTRECKALPSVDVA